MRAARKTQQRVGLALLGSVIVAVAVACYGPTEVRLEISRDVKCSPRGEARTGIFVGRPGHGAIDPIAETEDCTELGDAGSSIGSLVVVPSGDRSARVTVEVAIALKPRNPADPPKSPKDCLLDAKDCIVSRRTFSFISHTSRTIPIKLYEECRDRTCLPGTTCIANDCKPDDFDDPRFCGDRAECNLLPLEAGVDAPPLVDAPVDVQEIDAGGCLGPNGDGIISGGVNQPSEIRATATSLFWLAQSGMEIIGVRKDGKGRRLVFSSPATPISAFTVERSRNRLWVANGQQFIVVDLVDTTPTVRPAIDHSRGSVVAMDAPGGAYLYFSAGGSTWKGPIDTPAAAVTLSTLPASNQIPANRLSARLDKSNGETVYAVSATAFYRHDGGAGQSVPQSPTTDVVAFPGGAYVGLDDAVTFFADPAGTATPASSANAPKTMVHDGTSLYWTQPNTIGDGGATILKLDQGSPPVPVSIPHATGVVGLEVDATCVYYWANNAIRVATKPRLP